MGRGCGPIFPRSGSRYTATRLYFSIYNDHADFDALVNELHGVEQRTPQREILVEAGCRTV